jgi:ribosomal protein S18 acetylase RimI-like enzyme
MFIRPLAPKDKPILSQILRQRGTFNEKEVSVALELIDEVLVNRPGNDYHIYCACDESDEAAGYICFGPIPMTDYCYDLYWIAVDEKFARKGVGQQLLCFMENFVLERGARKIYVETSSTPLYGAARAFYKKHRYDIVAVFTDFYRVGDHKMVFMREIAKSGTVGPTGNASSEGNK